MRALILLVLLSTLLVVPVSADNVTIELFQNSQDVFFVQYNDELFECTEYDECTFEVANFTDNCTYDNGTVYDLSIKDKKEIAEYTAQYIALEIDFSEYNNGVNESFLTDSLIVTRNEMIDSVNARTQNSFVPSVDEINAVKANLTEAQNQIIDLKAEASSHAIVIDAKDEKIATLEDSKGNTELAAIGFAILFVGSLLFMGNKARDAMDWWKSRRK